MRWRDGGRGTREQQRTFKQPASPGQPTALAQARAFSDELDRRKRLGGVVDLDRGRVTLAVFVETYWQLHAVPNLAATTRDVYALVRALVAPFPGAFTYLRGLRLIVWRATPVANPPANALSL